MSNTNPDASYLAPTNPEVGAEDYQARPRNLEMEQALLGAIIVDNEAINKVVSLEPHHFSEPLHERIFETTKRLIERGQLAVPATLKTYLESDEGLQAVGGGAYLGRLAEAAVPTFYVEEYGRTIYDLSLRRSLIDIGEETAARANASDAELPAMQQIEERSYFPNVLSR